jgi:hypothetical protein
LHSDIAAGLSAAAPVIDIWIVERDIEGFELVYGLVKLATKGIEGLIVLCFGASGLR